MLHGRCPSGPVDRFHATHAMARRRGRTWTYEVTVGGPAPIITAMQARESGRERSKRGRRKERELDGATVTKRKTQNNAASIRTIIQTSQNDKCRTCWTLATGCS